MRFGAVIFDLDGTLLDTLEDIGDSVNAVLRGLGHPGHPIDAYRYFVGEGVPRLVEKSFPKKLRPEKLLEKRIAAVRAEYGRRADAKTRPYAGIPELLDDLTRRALPLAILSNKPDPFTRQSVGSLLSRWSFAAVRGALPDKPLKPDPTAARELIAGLRFRPERVLYLGDTGVDMQTALAAGMFPAGALWGFRDEAELKEAGARALIKTPPELLSLL